MEKLFQAGMTGLRNQIDFANLIFVFIRKDPIHTFR